MKKGGASKLKRWLCNYRAKRKSPFNLNCVCCNAENKLFSLQEALTVQCVCFSNLAAVTQWKCPDLMSQVTNSQHVVCQKQRAPGEDMSLPNECSLRVSLCSAAAVCLPPLLNKYCCQIIHLSAFSTSTFWQRACLCCDPKTRLRFQSLVTWRPSYKALVSAGLKI